MASMILGAPGTEAGPCKNASCGHSDCEATRHQADIRCQVCDDAIGYRKRFYQIQNGLVHATCEEMR